MLYEQLGTPKRDAMATSQDAQALAMQTLYFGMGVATSSGKALQRD